MPPPEIYTLSLHDALPIYSRNHLPGGTAECELRILPRHCGRYRHRRSIGCYSPRDVRGIVHLESRSEEHTSELQSLTNLVCRLLLEKKNSTSRPKLIAVRY